MSSFIKDLVNADYREFLLEVAMIRNGMKVYEKYAEDEPCQICWNSVGGEYTFKLVCGHLYHRNCMLNNIINYNRGGCEVCKVTGQNKKPAPEA